ncbi:VOC family protein [Chloroflexota bacterium]
MEKEKTIGNIDHVVIAVRSIEQAKPHFSEFLEVGEFIEIGTFEEAGLRSVMSPNGVELIEPIGPGSDVAKYLDRKGEGLYALAFRTQDAGKAKAKAEKMGIRVVGDITIDNGPAKGLREIWLHPKDNLGTYIMLTQGNPYHL